MTSRRSFLQFLGAGLVTPFALPTGTPPQQAPSGAAAKAVKVFGGFGGAVGLQLYSLRKQLEKDVPGTLTMVRNWGLTEVETAGYYGLTAAAFAEELKRAGLTAKSMHAGYELLRDDMKQAIADAKALGVMYVTVPWIPHEGAFAAEHADRAAAHFTEWGKALKDEGLQLMYHMHGYEFDAGPRGTLLDGILQGTPPDAVWYEMDVFWTVRGGGDPVALLTREKGRFAALHLKGMAKGTPTGDFSGQAPDSANVPLGTGMIDYPAVLRAARDAGAKLYYLEDESDRVLEQVPRSLEYLGGLQL